MKTLVLKNTRRGLKAMVDGNVISGVAEIVVNGIPREGTVTLKFVASKVIFEQETIEEYESRQDMMNNAEGEGR